MLQSRYLYVEISGKLAKIAFLNIHFQGNSPNHSHRCSSPVTRPPPLISRSSSDTRPLLASTSSPVLDFVVFLSKATGCSFSDSHPPLAIDFLLLACATVALLYLFRAGYYFDGHS
ncbi:hypothetical protein LWI29_012380 [Acer saccharum]|uniref:Uncharacterized protein n=1 Tax=Acer saccharum TaxID=4024 RepID=A0AA39RZB6_ACESA|nr:hypothetical protein LWI29_012380 [Acer saccharum]